MGGSMGQNTDWPSASGALVGGISGAHQAKVLHGKETQRQDRLNALQNQMLGNNAQGNAAGEAYIKQANTARVGGFDSAIADAQRVEDQGTQNALLAGQQAQGNIRAGAAGRGMLGSSVMGNMAQGAAAQTTRAITDAQIAASHLKSSALIGKGNAQASGLGALASFEAYKSNSKNAIMQNMWNFFANQQFTAQNSAGGFLAGSLAGGNYKNAAKGGSSDPGGQGGYTGSTGGGGGPTGGGGSTDIGDGDSFG